VPTRRDWLVAWGLVLAGLVISVASALFVRGVPSNSAGVVMVCGLVLIMVGARLFFRHLVVRHGQTHVPTWLGLLILLALLTILPLMAYFNED
jgi:predicted tellurium resistance membrane protein TerC